MEKTLHHFRVALGRRKDNNFRDQPLWEVQQQSLALSLQTKKQYLKARELVGVFHLREKGAHQGYTSERREGSHWCYMGEERGIPPGLQG